MPSSSTSSSSAPQGDSRIRSALENQSVKFHIKTGGSKWECTLTDRATHERIKASRATSSASVSTTSSESSSVSSK